MFFSKYIWYKSGEYVSEDYFKEQASKTLYKKNRGFYTVKELLDLINIVNELSLNDEVYDIIPLGRVNGFIDRDNEFFINVLNQITPENVCYINFTTHGPAVAAALQKKGVVSIWDISIDVYNEAFKRIINQLQDYSNILKENISTSSSMGIILDSTFELMKEVDFSSLPTAEVLQNKDINKVVIIIERPADIFFDVDTLFMSKIMLTCYSNFVNYITRLRSNGVIIELLSADMKTSERLPEVEKTEIDMDDYLNNFAINNYEQLRISLKN